MQAADNAGALAQIDKPVDPYLEMATVIAALDGRPVVFNQVAGSEFRVLSGQCSDRRYFAMALGCQVDELIFRMADAFQSPQAPPRVDRADAPCQQVVMPVVDLQRLPFLTHYADDAGPYATAAIAIVDDPDTGPNVSFHRCLRLDSKRLAARIVERRGTDSALKKTPSDLPVAICIGLPLHVLLAASMAPDPGVDELAIAHALAPTPVTKCLTNDLYVPAEAEFVLEGRITHRTVAEGPFVDLTETWDIVRQQPVIEIDCITHRRDAIYHALLPGMLEHKMLMGMPKEPSIYAAVNEVCDCLNVSITPGGTSWLHAVVQIPSNTPTTAEKPARPPSADTARSSTSPWWTTTSTSTTQATSNGPSLPASRPTATWWCGQTSRRRRWIRRRRTCQAKNRQRQDGAGRYHPVGPSRRLHAIARVQTCALVKADVNEYLQRM